LSLFSHLAWLELRQQLRSHVFWIVFAVSLLMVLGAAAIDALRLDAASGLGSGAGPDRPRPPDLDLVLPVHRRGLRRRRGHPRRSDPLRPARSATPVPQRTYIFARFAGALGALCLCFLSVPAALLAAPLMPGADPCLVAALSCRARTSSPSVCSRSRTCSCPPPCSSRWRPPPAPSPAASWAQSRC
jgi:hypothetical protein